MLRNMKIAFRATVSFALVALMVFGLGFFALYEIRQMRNASDEIERLWLPSVVTAGQLDHHFLLMRISTLRLMLSPDQAAISQGETGLAQERSELQKALAQYKALVSSSEEQAVYDRLQGSLSRYLEGQQQLIGNLRAGDLEGARGLANGLLRDLGTEATQALQALVDINQKGASTAAAATLAAFDEALYGVVTAMVRRRC